MYLYLITWLLSEKVSDILWGMYSHSLRYHYTWRQKWAKLIRSLVVYCPLLGIYFSQFTPKHLIYHHPHQEHECFYQYKISNLKQYVYKSFFRSIKTNIVLCYSALPLICWYNWKIIKNTKWMYRPIFPSIFKIHSYVLHYVIPGKGKW